MGNIFLFAVCHGLNNKGLHAHDFEKRMIISKLLLRPTTALIYSLLTYDNMDASVKIRDSKFE